MNDLDMYNNDKIWLEYICNIFNKCSEQVQINFIKLLFHFNKNTLNDLNISNINTIKELLKWGVSSNNSTVILYILTHKDVKLDSDFYYSLEKSAKNPDLINFIDNYRIKDCCNNSSDDSSNYDDSNSDDNSSDNDDSSSIFSSDLDRSYDEDEDEEDENNYNDIKYGKHINPKDVIEVD